MSAEIGVKIGADVSKFNSEVKKAQDSVKQFSDSGQREIARLNKLFGELGGASINNLKERIQEVKETLSNLKPYQDGALGAALIKDLGKSQAALKELTKETDNFGKNAKSGFAAAMEPANKFYSIVRRVAYILPGVGIGTIFAALIEPIQAATVAIIEYYSKVDKAKEAQKLLSSIMTEAADQYSKGETKLVSFVQRINDHNRSNAETRRLMRQINDEYDKYGVRLQNAAELEKFAAKTASALAGARYIEAAASAAEALADAQRKIALEKSVQSAEDATSFWQKFGAEAKSSLSSFTSWSKFWRTEDQLQKDYLSNLDQTRKGDVQKAEDYADKYTKIFTGLQKTLSDWYSKHGLKDPELKDPTLKKEKVGKYVDKDKDLQYVFNGLFSGLLNTNREMRKFEVMYDKFLNGPKLRLTTSLGLVHIKEDLINAGNALQQIQDKAEKAGEVLTKTLKPAFDQLFYAIFDGSRNALQAFADALKRIIAQLIAAAVEAAIFAAITSAISGGTMTFAGQFSKMFSSFSGLPKFAEGGVATGPRSGYLAMLHGTEIITPIDKAKNTISSGGASQMVTLQPSLQFSGDMLRIVLNRVDVRRARV